jgi:hypothetical protein
MGGRVTVPDAPVPGPGGEFDLRHQLRLDPAGIAGDPSFKGVREDKPAKSVIVERPAARDR